MDYNPIPPIIEGFNKILPGGFSNILVFGLQIGFAIAFGTIIYAGFLYMTSGDDSSKQKDAIEWIKAAVQGLIIIAGAMIILRTINPNLILPQ